MNGWISSVHNWFASSSAAIAGMDAQRSLLRQGATSWQVNVRWNDMCCFAARASRHLLGRGTDECERIRLRRQTTPRGRPCCCWWDGGWARSAMLMASGRDNMTTWRSRSVTGAMESRQAVSAVFGRNGSGVADLSGVEASGKPKIQNESLETH